MDLDISNKFYVGASADVNARHPIRILRPIAGSLTREDALNLATWIVAIVDPEMKEFDPLVEAILNA